MRHNFPGVTLLENEQVALGDTILCGATLWTDMGGGDPLAEHTVQRGMSDFYVIEKRDGDRIRALRPSDARARFVSFARLYRGGGGREPGQEAGGGDPPCPEQAGGCPVAAHEQDQSRPTSPTCTAFIENRPNIGVWIHGHTHVQTEYAIGECRVLSNARGYAGRERAAASFEPDRWFEI